MNMQPYSDYWRNPEQYVNVIWLDDDPTLASQQYCDRHVVKGIFDCAQILSSVWRVEALKWEKEEWAKAYNVDWLPPSDYVPPRELDWLSVTLCGQRIYRERFAAHPSISWARQYGGNYAWAYRLGVALLEEHIHRFGRVHAVTPALRTLEAMPPTLLRTADQYCDGPVVLPHELLKEGLIESYRNYYKKSKANLQYTKRQPPEWLGAKANYKGGD